MELKKKKRLAHAFGICITILILAILVYALVNYKFLKNEITDSVASMGLAAMFVFSFLLEAFPTIIGLEPPVLAAMLIEIGFLKIITAVIAATIIANCLSFLLGYKASRFMMDFVKPENRKKYKELWKKYGTLTMVITAITPIPYIPAIAGIFKMRFWYFATAVMSTRIARHIVVFGAMYIIVKGIF